MYLGVETCNGSLVARKVSLGFLPNGFSMFKRIPFNQQKAFSVAVGVVLSVKLRAQQKKVGKCKGVIDKTGQDYTAFYSCCRQQAGKLTPFTSTQNKQTDS